MTRRLDERRLDERRLDERAQVAGVETVALGVLVFIVGLLIATNAWSVLRTRGSADSIAAAYLRAYTQATTRGAALAAGRDAAETVRAAERVDPHRMVLAEPGGFAPCQDVTTTVVIRVPIVRIPLVGSAGSTTVSVTRHERVDPYRAGMSTDDGAEQPCAG